MLPTLSHDSASKVTLAGMDMLSTSAFVSGYKYEYTLSMPSSIMSELI